MNKVTNWENVPIIFNVSYAEKLLNINKRAVQRLAVSKKIPAFKISGKWMFSKDDVVKWIEKLKTNQSETRTEK